MSIKNIFIVDRPELKSRWGHRLATVLIFGSTLVVLIAIGVSNLWDIGSQSDFTQNTSKSFVSPESSVQLPAQDKMLGSFDIQAFAKQAREQGYSDQAIVDYLRGKGLIPAENMLKTQPENQVSKNNSGFLNLLAFVGTGIAGAFFYAFLWFIFWESIIYRTIIYIILGSKNKEKGVHQKIYGNKE